MGPEQWSQVSVALTHMFLFVGLAINTALAFLLGHGVIPSLVTNSYSPQSVLMLRRALYPISAISLVLALFALSRAITAMIAFLQQFFPRFAI
jgi:hypothetical protein